ncbi:MAG: ATP-binding cassette domain-containing protein [Lachnospira sp.]
MDMLTVTDVKKSFGSKVVVDGLSFSIPKNSIFGFVGENGAGKTTTMKMILGLMKMDSGEILVDGTKVVYGNTPTNRKIGYLPDVPEFYTYMTPREYLRFCGEITGLSAKEINPRVDELLQRVGLANENKKIKGFSRGMKQRLGIAQALMGKPMLLICDEPTSALDPLGRKELLDILVASKDETTIMFSTHILSDVERICDRIAFLHQGKLALSGSIGDIKKMNTKEEYEVVVQNKDDSSLLQMQFHNAVKMDDYTFKIHVDSENSVKQIMQFLLEKSIAIEKIEKCENTLENLFMEVVGK